METQVQMMMNHHNNHGGGGGGGDYNYGNNRKTRSNYAANRSLKQSPTPNNENFVRSASKKQTSASLKKKPMTSTSYINPEFLDPETNKRRNTKRAHQIRKYKKFLKYNDTTAAILGILGLFFAVEEYEIFFDHSYKPIYSSTSDSVVYRTLVSITTAVVIWLLMVHSFIAYKLALEKGTSDADIGYFSSRNFKQLILEILVIGIHCPPTVDTYFEVYELDYALVYSVPGCLMCWMLLRFYLVFRLFAQYSKWTNELAEECCEPEGCEANTIFAMKAVLKEKPFFSLMILMSISALIFGLAVRHFERPFWYYNPNVLPTQNYDSVWNGMWLIMITMMTVGYGDFYPHTHMGRFVCILACFWGVFLVSMMVVTLTVVSSFDQKQKRAYDILYRLNIKEEIKKKASFVIVLVIRWRVLVNKYEKKSISKDEYFKEKIKILGKLDMRLQFFRDLVAQINDYEITSEESLRQLTEKIDRDLDEVKAMLESLTIIEKQLDEIEKSQNVVVMALNECLLYTNDLENFVNTYVEKGQGGQGGETEIINNNKNYEKFSPPNYVDTMENDENKKNQENIKSPIQGLISFD